MFMLPIKVTTAPSVVQSREPITHFFVNLFSMFPSVGAQSQWQRPTTPNYEGQSHTLVCLKQILKTLFKIKVLIYSSNE